MGKEVFRELLGFGLPTKYRARISKPPVGRPLSPWARNTGLVVFSQHVSEIEFTSEGYRDAGRVIGHYAGETNV